MNDDWGCGFLIILFLGMALSAVLASGCQQNLERNEAIKAGVAEWQVDPKTGDTSFVYRNSKDSNP